MKLIPKNNLGVWSLWLCFLFVVFFVLTQVFNAVGWNFLIPAFSVISLLSGLAGFVLAIIAFKRKERALLIYVPMIFGLLIIFFVLGEIFFPH